MHKLGERISNALPEPVENPLYPIGKCTGQIVAVTFKPRAVPGFLKPNPLIALLWDRPVPSRANLSNTSSRRLRQVAPPQFFWPSPRKSRRTFVIAWRAVQSSSPAASSTFLFFSVTSASSICCCSLRRVIIRLFTSATSRRRFLCRASSTSRACATAIKTPGSS